MNGSTRNLVTTNPLAHPAIRPTIVVVTEELASGRVGPTGAAIPAQSEQMAPTEGPNRR